MLSRKSLSLVALMFGISVLSVSNSFAQSSSEKVVDWESEAVKKTTRFANDVEIRMLKDIEQYIIKSVFDKEVQNWPNQSLPETLLVKYAEIYDKKKLYNWLENRAVKLRRANEFLQNIGLEDKSKIPYIKRLLGSLDVKSAGEMYVLSEVYKNHGRDLKKLPTKERDLIEKYKEFFGLD